MEVWSGSRNEFERSYKLPVILVPGIMGSRLKIYLSNNNVVLWNPDSKISIANNIGRKTARQKREILNPVNKTEFPRDIDISLMQMTTVAPPRFGVPSYQELGFGGGAIDAETKDEFESKICDHLISKGWNEVVWDYYGKFLVTLQEHSHSFQGADFPVYAVGYDWRGSNAKSAQRLHERIQDVTEKENADQVVIITHSMGGLVARSYVDQYGEDLVQGVIHISQPTHGAPLLYRRLRVGALTQEQQALLGSYGGLLGGWDKFIWSVLIEGEQTDPESAATIVGVMNGALELLPTSSYRMERTEQVPYSSWLSWPEWWADGEQPPKDVSSLYQQSTNRLGIIPPDFEFREDLEQRISEAVSFQEEIDETFHTNTYWICSDGINTDVAVRIEPLQKKEMMIENRYGTGVEVKRVEPYEGPENSKSHDFGDQGLRVIHYFPEQGDGTVPLDSQLGFEMKSGVHEPEDKKIKRMQGIEHSKICTYESVQWRVTEWIQNMISSYARQCLSKKPS